MIVDTNAVSAFAEGDLSIREKIAESDGPYIPVIVIGEYRFGLMESRERERRLAWIDELSRHWIVLEISLETATTYAEIRQTLRERATPIPANDVWIAALARRYRLPI